MIPEQLIRAYEKDMDLLSPQANWGATLQEDKVTLYLQDDENFFPLTTCHIKAFLDLLKL